MNSLSTLALTGLLLVAPLAPAALACEGQACIGACHMADAGGAGAAAAAKPTLWTAPFDDQKPRQVALFGLIPTAANEGTLDRAVRVALGAGLTYLSITDPFTWGLTGRVATGVGAGLMGWTAFTGSCPAYLPFGINTRFGAEAAAR